MINWGTRYKIEDLTALTDSTSDDIVDVMMTVDFLHKQMNHEVKVLNTETGIEFLWRRK